jgi:hypothetical protein
MPGKDDGRLPRHSPGGGFPGRLPGGELLYRRFLRGGFHLRGGPLDAAARAHCIDDALRVRAVLHRLFESGRERFPIS